MNFILKFYYSLPNFARIGFPGKVVNRSLEFIWKRLLDLFLPAYYLKQKPLQGNVLNTIERGQEYIVSLTSFPARIDYVWITVESILRQSFIPDKVILWLAESQFPDKKLPDSLLRLQSHGLTIAFCEDLRSHKKYYYSFLNFPDSVIITMDDDTYYEEDVLKRLVEDYKRYPNCVVCNRGHKIEFRENRILPYRLWKHNAKSPNPGHHFLQTGCGGVLYPPKLVHPDIFKKEIFLNHCMYADDIWLKVQAYRNGTMIKITSSYNKDFPTVKASQQSKLVHNNSHGGGNDEQLKALMDYYKIMPVEFQN